MSAPVFLISLPRSGSTLLQRILMGHSQIQSVAEPWFLLPVVYAEKEQGAVSEYSNLLASEGISDFIGNLSQGKKTYHDALRSFAMKLYDDLCQNGEQYFLDKTPRYYLIVKELKEIFPDARFIFLSRNPLHVISSVIQTWNPKNLRRIYSWHIDFRVGFPCMAEGINLLEGSGLFLNYESLVKNPEQETRRICEFLGVSYEPAMLSSYKNQKLEGSMGDKTGFKQYSEVSDASLDKWKVVVHNWVRKRFYRKILESYSESDYEVQGYNKKEVLQTLREHTVGWNQLLSDVIFLNYASLISKTNIHLYLHKLRRIWVKKRYLS